MDANKKQEQIEIDGTPKVLHQGHSPWIITFLRQPENDFFCLIDKEFLKDTFN